MTTTRCPRRAVFHVRRGQPYHLENSLRGVRLAVARLFGWIDLDCHVTSDGVLVITHWPKPLRHGFCDPLGLIHPAAEVEDLTWEEVSRLVSRDGLNYRIHRADRIVPYALRLGIKVELEVKTAKITRSQLSALGQVSGFTASGRGFSRHDIQVKGFPQFLPALHAAHRAGYTTIVLTHPGHRRVPADARTWLDYFRGRRPLWTGKA